MWQLSRDLVSLHAQFDISELNLIKYRRFTHVEDSHCECYAPLLALKNGSFVVLGHLNSHHEIDRVGARVSFHTRLDLKPVRGQDAHKVGRSFKL